MVKPAQLLAPVCLMLIVGCAPSIPPTASVEQANKPPAAPVEQAKKPPDREQADYPVLLATIDGNAGDPIKVNRYRSLLSQLDQAFIETAEQIADMSANAKQQLEDEGVSVDVLPIVEGMNLVLPVPIKHQKYAEYTAAYMVLRTKGQAHEDAINGLRALVNSIVNGQ